MPKIKYQVTDSRGQVHKRTSTHRIYTHAVVVHISSSEWNGKTYPARTIHEWAGRLELAHNVARRWEREQTMRNATPTRVKEWGGIEGIELLPAERVS